MAAVIKHFFDEDTSTFTYVVSDPKTSQAAIIDSVLGYDQYSGVTTTNGLDTIITYIKLNNLNVTWILDTHIHADHITGSHYLRDRLGGKIGIGEHIKVVLDLWVPVFNTKNDTPINGSQFDCLFKEGDTFNIGELVVTVLHTPGHTPACVSYLINDAVFVGDTLFMPDLGTARTDFPGGSASDMYHSIQKILNLPDNTKIFFCHDYPLKDRDVSYYSTVKAQKDNNVLIATGITEEEYIQLRNNRDAGKAVPKLLLPAIQVNLRAGSFGMVEDNDTKYVKIPVDKLPS